MSDTQSGGKAPGWYADPTGQAGVRWWDGSQWTAHTAPLPSGGHASAATGQRPRIPDSTPVYTPFIWVYVLLPLASAIALLFYRPSFPSLSNPQAYARQSVADIITPGYVALLLVSLLVYVGLILMACFDHRALRQAGVVRPFHWAWSFFVFVSLGMVVYPIGRSIIVHQVARPRGLVPIWVMIGTVVVTFVISIGWVVAVLAPLFASLPRTA